MNRAWRDKEERGPKILERLNAEKLVREVIEPLRSGRAITRQT
jgi:hypothetical protein